MSLPKLSTNKNLGIKWPLYVGAFGFLAGFILPLILRPESNQGPLLGIFITGPGGFLLGLALWALTKIFHWNIQRQWNVLCLAWGLILFGVVATLMAPKPNWLGRLYGVEVTACRPVSSEAEATIQAWNKRMADFAWRTPRQGWENEIKNTLEINSGSIVSTNILTEKVVKKETSLFGDEKILASELTWVGPMKIDFYISESCSELPVGLKKSYFVSSEEMQIMPTEKNPWPPLGVGDILIRATLLPVPTELKSF